MSEETTQKSPATSPDPSAPRQRRFRCKECQRNFNRREHLQRHLTIHYGQKPFNCPNCDYACRRRDLLNRHIKLSHRKEPAGEAAGAGGTAPAIEDQPARPLSAHTAPAASENAIAFPLIPNPAGGLEHEHGSSYPGAAHQVPATQDPYGLLGPNGDSQPFSLNYLDNVALPFLVDQPALFPELPLNDLFSYSPLEGGTIGIQPGVETAPLDGLGAPNALATPPDVGRHHVHLAPFLRVSQDDWLWLGQEVSRFSSVLPPQYKLPSRHAISRYFHGFLNGFHPHFPIIHPQTLTLRGTAPELTLALAAVGSQYCLESHQGVKLFRLSRAIALERIRLRDLDDKDGGLQNETARNPPMEQTPISLPHSSNREVGLQAASEVSNGYRFVETMQALFYLMAMATWGGENRSLVRQAIATQSILAVLVRQHGLTDAIDDATAVSGPMSWKQWVQAESARRTKLIIFCFFNLHTIVFNLPSPLMIVDIQLLLPCSEAEWKACDPDTWLAVHQRPYPAPLFQDCISDLLRDSAEAPICSSLGSHVLIHALLQHIFSLRQATRLENMGGLSPGSFLILRQALKKWQIGWELNPESSLSPLDKHGPIAFNSTALFHLAHLRIVTDIGAERSILEQSHEQIARKLRDQPMLHRGPTLLLAARHATVALCSPVQMGVYFVGRVPSWSVMHAVCSLEYAYILSQFLQATTAPNMDYALQPDEQALLVAIKETLGEVESSRPDGDPDEIEAKPQLLQSKAVRAWALILQGFRTWNAVALITRALFAYADMVDPEEVCHYYYTRYNLADLAWGPRVLRGQQDAESRMALIGEMMGKGPTGPGSNGEEHLLQIQRLETSPGTYLPHLITPQRRHSLSAGAVPLYKNFTGSGVTPRAPNSISDSSLDPFPFKKMDQHPWHNITLQLGQCLEKFNEAIDRDPQFLAFTHTEHISKPITFAIKSSGSDDAILFTFNQTFGNAEIGKYPEALFSLVALPSQWQNVFKKNPEPPYQSFWGLHGQNIRPGGVEVLGDELAFTNYARIWRAMLDVLHHVYCGPNDVSPQPEQSEDFLVGRYVFIMTKAWGRCKIFYEQSGTGTQDIVFLHTAGSDSRQYHGVMNDARMRARCNMVAFDLPSHGRSFPSPAYALGGHSNGEDAYMDCIAAVIKGLKLTRPILCGASMAGQACIAAAIRCEEVGVSGTIPLQGCERVEMQREWYDKSPLINSATFNPEWVYGMMCPTAPLENRQLLWHTYSAQAYGVYHGDLDFYFDGWDGRGRVETIDTKKCPVYFLVGEYDWSNTPEMTEETARKIPGAQFKRMPNLGHFPATENPAIFVPYLLEAVGYIASKV